MHPKKETGDLRIIFVIVFQKYTVTGKLTLYRYYNHDIGIIRVRVQKKGGGLEGGETPVLGSPLRSDEDAMRTC